MARGERFLWACLLLSSASSVACVFDDEVPAAPPPRVACTELSTTNPWEDQLGAHPLADRGTLLRCVHALTFTAAEVAASPLFPAAVGPAANGYDLFVIQYVSEGRPGVARAVTALAYLPSGGATGVPIAAVDHTTSGIGPLCGPSHASIITDPLAVPLVGRGYAVVATDYAGMGVDNGMTSYLVGTAEAAATLDGVRALRALHDPRFDAAQLGTDFFVVGHSQGGHAALFTHQLFEPSAGVRFLGSVALAPGLGRAQEWATFFDDPARPVGGMETFALMSLYARMLYGGAPDPGAWLSPAAQAALPQMLHDQCLLELLASLPGRFPTLGDLYQGSFLTQAASCSFDVGCPSFEPWASAFAADQPGVITSEVPSLVAQGLADPIVPPATVACVVDRMKAHGTPVQACAYAGADHVSIVSSAIPDAIRWMTARRAGTTPDVCPAPLAVACGTQ
jgi:pimeloyl-ACP methyl ester carboxylesterase